MKLPRIFSRGMVVQQGLPIPVWGWSSPHQHVVVSLGGRSAETQADAKGGWMVRLPRLQASDHLGAELSLHIAADQDLTIEGVAVGEVWLCAGQRALPGLPAGHHPSPAARLRAGAPPLRLFTVEPAHGPRPCEDVVSLAGWREFRARAQDAFGILAGAFAAALQEALSVPLGVILLPTDQAAVESWVGRAALASEHQLRAVLERAELAGATAKESAPTYRKLLSSWQGTSCHADPGNRGIRRGWHKPGLDEDGWGELALPGRWSAAGHTGAGATWLRRTVALPAAWKGRALQLSLGRIEESDRAYVQGTLVGATTRDAASGARCYGVPGRLTRGRSLTIALRVFASQGPGGLVGAPDDLHLTLAPAVQPKARSRNAIVALDGAWRCRSELELSCKESSPPPLHDRHPEVPAALNNGMIQPLVPYGLRGALWLHGARGRYHAEQYRSLLASLVRDWRTAWGQGDFPFALVQLPDGAPAALHEAERAASLQAKVGLVSGSADPAGNAALPADLPEVGRRLAQWARTALPG